MEESEKIEKLFSEREQIVEAYQQTLLYDATGNLLSTTLLEPMHVISAENPYEYPCTREENERRTEALKRYLQAYQYRFVEVTACSSQGTWREQGFGIYGLSRDQARSISHTFQQRAFFELEDTHIQVFYANGSLAARTAHQRG